MFYKIKKFRRCMSDVLLYFLYAEWSCKGPSSSRSTGTTSLSFALCYYLNLFYTIYYYNNKM